MNIQKGLVGHWTLDAEATSNVYQYSYELGFNINIDGTKVRDITIDGTSL